MNELFNGPDGDDLLCIGGPKDGQRIRCQGDSVIVLSYGEPRFAVVDGRPVMPKVVEDAYVVERAGPLGLRFLRWKHMAPEVVMFHLLRAYEAFHSTMKGPKP